MARMLRNAVGVKPDVNSEDLKRYVGCLYFCSEQNIPYDPQLVQSLLDQAHLSPLTINIQPTLADYDHSLRLYPLPTAVSNTVLHYITTNLQQDGSSSLCLQINTTSTKSHTLVAMFSTQEVLLETPSCSLLTNLPKSIRKNGKSLITFLRTFSPFFFLFFFAVFLTWTLESEAPLH